MVNTLLALALIAGPNIYGGNALYPDQLDFSGSGTMFTDLDLNGYKLYGDQSADAGTHLQWSANDWVMTATGDIIMVAGGNTLLTLDASTQQMLVPSGTAAYPIIALDSDIDTGFYFDASGRPSIGFGNAAKLTAGSASVIAYVDFNTNGNRVYSGPGALNIGNDYIPTQGGVTGSVAIGKDAGNISLEVEGLSYFMDALTMSGGGNVAAGTFQLDDNRSLVLGSGIDYYMQYSNSDTELLLVSSDIDGGGTDGTVWSVQDGTDDIDFAGSVTKSDDTKGAIDGWYQDTQDLVFTAESSKSTTGTFIVDGARSLSVVGRITTGFTGACASLDVGDSSTVNAFADAIALAQGTTFDTTDQTVTLTQELTGDEVTVTANGGTCSGTIRVVLSYFKPSAPTSN